MMEEVDPGFQNSGFSVLSNGVAKEWWFKASMCLRQGAPLLLYFVHHIGSHFQLSYQQS